MRSKVIEKQVIYTGKRCRLEVHRMQNEVTGAKHQREVVVHPGAVIVLGITNENEVLLIRTRRHAVDEVLVELPAGTLEAGELPINCAGRELLEETGYLAGKMTPLASFYTSPGILSEKMHAFVATKLSKRTQALEEGEEIEVMPTPLEEAVSMAVRGEIRDGKTLATLLTYAGRNGIAIRA
jgi:ADP-ribose pyrophosphatase